MDAQEKLAEILAIDLPKIAEAVRQLGPNDALVAMRAIMQRVGLTINETKTRMCRIPGERFDFLGNTIGRCWSPATAPTFAGSATDAVPG